MAQTGMLLGILLQLGYAMMASWTAYLMNTLYMEHVNRKERLKALSQYPSDPDERSAFRTEALHHMDLLVLVDAQNPAQNRIWRQVFALRSLAVVQRCDSPVPLGMYLHC